MNTGLPVYIPNAKVCHMDQYHCCKHRQHCRLYPRCAQIQLPTVCQRDCPSCSYEGCSLDAASRQSNPVYVDHVIQGDRTPMNLEGHHWQERMAHKKHHKKMYTFYNRFWGDLREKSRLAYQKRYLADPEYYRKRSRDAWRRKHPLPLKAEIPEGAILPECGLDCSSCPFQDCILPDDWREKELNRIRNRRYYARHREDLCKKQKERRQRPEGKSWRAEYNRRYQQNHPEKSRERSRRYRERHSEKIREIQRAYRQKNKDKINERRRQQYAARKSNGDPAHRKV